jgi:hypothetical protein
MRAVPELLQVLACKVPGFFYLGAIRGWDARQLMLGNKGDDVMAAGASLGCGFCHFLHMVLVDSWDKDGIYLYSHSGFGGFLNASQLALDEDGASVRAFAELAFKDD